MVCWLLCRHGSQWRAELVPDGMKLMHYIVQIGNLSGVQFGTGDPTTRGRFEE